MRKLADRVAIVTGATSGIGKATAVLFAREGAKVVITGRRRDRGESVVSEIRALGGVCQFIQARGLQDKLPPADPAQVEQAVNQPAELLRGMDDPPEVPPTVLAERGFVIADHLGIAGNVAERPAQVMRY